MKIRAVAFPGLPVIFAEGYHDARLSMHGHISLAVTSADGKARTETVVESSDKDAFIVDGNVIDNERGRGMLEVRDLILKKSGKKASLKITSRNHAILSGSSDSGAAALSAALNKFLGLNLGLNELHEFARHGSETAYRSLYGGLSEYYLKDKVAYARNLLHETELADIAIYAVPFDYPRYSADELHKAVVKHPNYPARIAGVEHRIFEFKSHLVERDFLKCLELMESDARDVHKMFEEQGFAVRKEKMIVLCSLVEIWRKSGIPCYWNVAGGSVVYVFTTSPYKKVLMQKLREYKPVEYKVAGPARLL